MINKEFEVGKGKEKENLNEKSDELKKILI